MGEKKEALRLFQPEKKQSAAHRKDELWDAMVGVFGYEPRLPSDRSLWNKLVNDLRAGGVGPAEVRMAAVGYRLLFSGDVAMTPTALVKHFEAALQRAQQSSDRYERQRNPRRLVSVDDTLRRAGEE